MPSSTNNTEYTLTWTQDFETASLQKWYTLCLNPQPAYKIKHLTVDFQITADQALEALRKLFPPGCSSMAKHLETVTLIFCCNKQNHSLIAGSTAVWGVWEDVWVGVGGDWLGENRWSRQEGERRPRVEIEILQEEEKEEEEEEDECPLWKLGEQFLSFACERFVTHYGVRER